MTAESAMYSATDYKYGFVTEVETDTLPKGLNEQTIRAIICQKRRTRFSA